MRAYAILVICLLLAFSSTPTFTTPQHDTAQFSAVVGKNEGVFTLPIEPKQNWSWRRPVEAIFKIKFPDEPEITQTIPIVYQE